MVNFKEIDIQDHPDGKIGAHLLNEKLLFCNLRII